jgi:hypothetical protein
MVVERRATLLRGRPANVVIDAEAENSKSLPLTKSTADLAKEAGISDETVKQAKQVRRNGSPELIKAVEQGGKYPKWDNYTPASVAAMRGDSSPLCWRTYLDHTASHKTPHNG